MQDHGDIPVRLKLKLGVRFKRIERDQRSCDDSKAQEAKNTVYISYPNSPPDKKIGQMDYFICSPDAIDSWSFGTKEAFNEAQADFDYTQKNPGRGDPYNPFAKGHPEYPFGISDTDSSNWTVPAIHERLDLLKSLSDSDLPRVFCANPREGCEQGHFASNYPTYFRPSKEAPRDIYPDGNVTPLGVEEHTLYIESSLFEAKLQPDALWVKEYLASHPTLKVVVISNDHRSNGLANFFGQRPVTLMSKQDFKEILTKSKSRVLQITADPSLMGPMSANFGDAPLVDAESHSGPSKSLAPLQNYIAKVDNAISFDRIDPSFYSRAFLDYELRQSVSIKNNELYTYAYKLDLTGKCSALELSMLSAFGAEPFPARPELCAIHR
jgi:hypothetical protein